mgnify:CR=1 FL=1
MSKLHNGENDSHKRQFLALRVHSQSWILDNLSKKKILVKLTDVTSCLLQFDRKFFCSNIPIAKFPILWPFLCINWNQIVENVKQSISHILYSNVTEVSSSHYSDTFNELYVPWYFIWLSNALQKLKIHQKYFLTLHFDEIFMKQFDFLVHEEEDNYSKDSWKCYG